MCPERSTTSLPRCGSRSSELSGYRSPTRPASLATATSARCLVRQRTTCKTTASLERSERRDSRPQRPIDGPLFIHRQPSHGALLQIAQFERPDRHSHQTQYSNPLRFEQTSDLPVFAFVESNLQPAILIAVPQKACSLGVQMFAGVTLEKASVNLASPNRASSSNSREQIGVRNAVHLHVIFLVQM